MIFCKKSNQKSYPFSLPELPYSKDAFSPHLSAESFDYHYGKHHQAYVTNLNNLLKDDTTLAQQDLESIILSSYKTNAAIFNNSAQIWNHTFFWHSIKPGGGGKPSGQMLAKIESDFGSYDTFLSEFKQAAMTQFGSGWAWLVLHEKKLKIVKTQNAETPITQGMKPLLACDVWEHAYYIDYRNRRNDFLTIFTEHLINWDFVSMHLEGYDNS